jgi:hypothetical protein
MLHNCVLFFMFVVGIIYSNEAASHIIVFSAECGTSCNSELIEVSNKPEYVDQQAATQNLLRFRFPDFSIAPKREGRGLAGPQQHPENRNVGILTLVRPFHRQRVYARSRPINFAMGLGQPCLGAANIHHVKLPINRVTGKEDCWVIDRNFGWSHNNIADANLGTLRENKSEPRISSATYRGDPQTDGRNRQYASESRDPEGEKCLRVACRVLPEGFVAFTFWTCGLIILFGLPIVVGATLWFLRPQYARNEQRHNGYK